MVWGRRGYMEALIICFNGGAFAAILDMYVSTYVLLIPVPITHPSQNPTHWP